MWKSYLINLTDNTVRMENSARQFEQHNIPFERIDAVNGWKLSQEEIDQVYDAKKNATKGRSPLVLPEIGCYLSHINAWKKIAENNEPGGFVFEDDFLAEDHLGETLELLSDEMLDWDMVKLFTFSPDAEIASTQKLGETLSLVEPIRVPTCLIAYGLTKHGAQRLLDTCMPFFRPVDEDQKFLWETELPVHLVLPAPIKVGDQEAATGTIGNTRRAAKGSGLARLKQRIHEIRYQLDYRSRLKRHWKNKKSQNGLNNE